MGSRVCDFNTRYSVQCCLWAAQKANFVSPLSVASALHKCSVNQHTEILVLFCKEPITDLTSSILIQQISEIKNTTSQSLEIKLKGTKIETPKICTGRWPCWGYVQDQTVKCLATWSLHAMLLKTLRMVVEYMRHLWWPISLFRVIYSIWGERMKNWIIPKEILDLK